MNKINIFFQKRFLVYALLLHAGVALSFVIFNNEENENENDNLDKKRIIEVDVSAPKVDDSILAETFSEEELKDEINSIQKLSNKFSSQSKLEEANLAEKRKEYEAIKKQADKTKSNLLKERKKLRKDVQQIEEDRKAALKEKSKIEQEKRKIEEELKKIKKELEKKKANELALKKKKEIEAKKKKVVKKNIVSKEDWLNTKEGKSEYYRYGNAVHHKVKGKWIRPSEARDGWFCKLQIEQNKKGQIQGIKKVKCNPDKGSFYQSVHRAVMSASPLPVPKDYRLFDNKIDITFTVD